MDHLPFAPRTLALTLSLLFGGTVLSGCGTLQLESLESSEIIAATMADKDELQRNVEPLTGPLTLEDAIARAIKYNAAWLASTSKAGPDHTFRMQLEYEF